MWPIISLACLLLAPLAAFTASTDALPINHDALDPSNFKKTIASGVWLVEYFSPYCGHCREFAPTWDSLVEEIEGQPNPGIQLAKVDCAVHGDFCTEMKVDGYPGLFLYKKGVFVESFRGVRDHARLLAFIMKHAEPSPTPTTHQDAPTKAAVPSAAPSFYPSRPRADVNPNGAVKLLDEHSFQDTLNQGAAFVKFYAPWCGHCKKLAPVWTQLAKYMQHKLVIAEVNCEDHSALCTSQDVKGYPSLYFYANGIKSDYEGSRKLEKLVAFAERVSAPPVQELVLDDLEKHMQNDPVVYLLLYSPSNAHIISDISKASPFGIPKIYASSSKELSTRYSISSNTAWALIALKDHDPTTAVATLKADINGKVNSTEIGEWLLRQSLPTLLELDQDSFQSVMNARHRPLVVIAATPGGLAEIVKTKLQDVAAKWKLRHHGNSHTVIFTWMDSEKWSSWLTSMYGLRTGEGEDGVSVVITDHKRLIYWDNDQRGQKIRLTSTSIFSALEGIGYGTLRYKHSENLVERLVRNIGSQVTALEFYITTYPLRFIFGICTVLILVLIVIKRILMDTTAPTMHSRLD